MVWLERLCDHCGVVRVGADAPFPAPYDYSVTYVIRGKYAEPVGFDHPKATPSEFKEVVLAINQATGKLVAYDRPGPPPVRKMQVDPAETEGRVLMRAAVQWVEKAEADVRAAFPDIDIMFEQFDDGRQLGMCVRVNNFRRAVRLDEADDWIGRAKTLIEEVSARAPAHADVS